MLPVRAAGSGFPIADRVPAKQMAVLAALVELDRLLHQTQIPRLSVQMRDVSVRVDFLPTVLPPPPNKVDKLLARARTEFEASRVNLRILGLATNSSSRHKVAVPATSSPLNVRHTHSSSSKLLRPHEINHPLQIGEGEGIHALRTRRHLQPTKQKQYMSLVTFLPGQSPRAFPLELIGPVPPHVLEDRLCGRTIAGGSSMYLKLTRGSTHTLPCVTTLVLRRTRVATVLPPLACKPARRALFAVSRGGKQGFHRTRCVAICEFVIACKH